MENQVNMYIDFLLFAQRRGSIWTKKESHQVLKMLAPNEVFMGSIIMG